MNLSSNSCLKRIKQFVSDAGFKDITEMRIQKACLEENFDIKLASSKIIYEEQLKKTLESSCIQMGYSPNSKFITAACNKFNFQKPQTELYIKKLLTGRQRLQTMCVDANITVSDWNLDNTIIASFGDPWWAFNRIKQDHLY